MFLKFLEKENEKEAFLELAYLLIPMDGQFTNKEKKLLDEFKWELNFHKDFRPSIIESPEQLDKYLDILENNKKNLLAGLLIELIALAKVNQVYSSGEQKFIKHIAKHWELEKKLKDLEAWVDKYFLLLHELEKILSAEE